MPEGMRRPAKTDFWRSPLEGTEHDETGAAHEQLVCSACDTEFVIGSRFCHMCGARRGPKPMAGKIQRNLMNFSAAAHHLNLAPVREALGLNLASLIAFALGVICLVAALSVGMMYQVQTAIDWQAVQAWRMEWLLGAIAGFVAGILLRSEH
jgi:hypothetical protein